MNIPRISDLLFMGVLSLMQLQLNEDFCLFGCCQPLEWFGAFVDILCQGVVFPLAEAVWGMSLEHEFP